MKRVLILATCLALSLPLWADDVPAPPIPVPSGGETLPPPVDLGQMTPVAIPQSQPTETQKTEPAKVEKAPTHTPVPAPTDTPIPAPKAEAPAPTTPPAETSPALSVESTSSPQAGTLTDYFPASPGNQWSYEYLKPAEGQTAKGTFAVKCLSAKAMPNGTVRTVFETTEQGSATKEYYSLFNGKVEHMANEGTAETGDFAFKVPTLAGGAAYWTVTEKDGTVHKSKAVLGQAQVYQKTYPDCVVVTEKVLTGRKAVHTVIYYYAKGIGLVSMEVYSPAMKLIQTKSFALVGGPAAN